MFESVLSYSLSMNKQFVYSLLHCVLKSPKKKKQLSAVEDPGLFRAPIHFGSLTS